jgi:Ni/Fe-hydrogenase subunit HybB-like protein
MAETPKPYILKPGHTYTTVTDHISSRVMSEPPRGWWLGFLISVVFVVVFTISVAVLLLIGVGVWGINVPVAWGFDIVNMVWWAGVAHAGTLLSAVLLILRQEWRTSISRITEAITLFTAAIAALFPLLHLGRPWLFYYIFPYPNTMGLWPQFRSPLAWDVFAVLVHTILPFMFLYIALIPDLATLRDRAQNRRQHVIYSLFSLGWRGSVVHWHRFRQAYYMLAAMFIPLVISLHSIIAFIFAITLVPGWYSTILPVYFLAAAVLSGFSLVLTVIILLRAFYRLHDYFTLRHMDIMAKVILGSSLLLAFTLLIELFFAWYSGNENAIYVHINRLTGIYGPVFWSFLVLSVLAPQILWVRKLRINVPFLLFLSLAVNVGLWLKRYMIIVTSLHRDHLPSAWGVFTPTIWDWTLFAGSLGLFVAMMYLFIRFLPVISIFEMQELVEEKQDAEAG